MRLIAVLLFLVVLGRTGGAMAADRWAVSASFPGDGNSASYACSSAQSLSLSSMKTQCENDGARLVDFSFRPANCSCSRNGERFDCMASGKGFCQKEAKDSAEGRMVTAKGAGQGNSRSYACTTAQQLAMTSVEVQCADDGSKVMDFSFGPPDCQCSQSNNYHSCSALVKAYCGKR